MDSFPIPIQNKKPSANSNKPTKVLLFCIKNKANCLLTQMYLSNLFSKYGNPQKILIFEKNIIWKAFIEMDSIESAIKAHQALNNVPLLADGSRINIYFSDREVINFHHSKQSPDYLSPQHDPEIEKPYNMFAPSNVTFPLSFLNVDTNGKFHSNQELIYPEETANNIDTFSSTPVSHNPRSMEISYLSPIESSQAYFQQNQKKSYSSCEDFDDHHHNHGFPNNNNSEELIKKPKKPIRLMLTSTPFESSNVEKPITNELKRNSYTIIDSIKEEPHEKSPQEKKSDKSFHSIDNPESRKKQNNAQKSLNLFVPLSNSFNSNEDFLEMDDIQIYPEKNDEILLKNLPAKKSENDIPEVISRTPSPIPNNNNNIEEKHINNFKIENFEDENLLHLLPLDEEKDIGGEDHESMDSEYDNYHKFFDNLVLIEEKKSNEEGKKSQEGLLNESNESKSQKHSFGKISINSKSKTDQDILVKKRNKQRDAIEKIELDIKQSSDSYYKNSIKNMDHLLHTEKNELKHISLPSNLMTNSCGTVLGGFSEVSQSLTPINFLNISNNVMFGSPSPSSHFERFLFNVEPEQYMTNSSSFPENKKSKVVYVRGLENEYITLTIIYNLFSNFGNILKIIFLKKKSVALIDYETVLNASHAKDHLNNIVFFENSIKIFYSNYSEINLKSQDSPSEEVFIGNDDTCRFKKNKPISINPPSNVLHVSNLKRDVCKSEIIVNIFSPYGTIECVKFLVMDHYKNMCLVKFASLEQSLVAMAYLHGKDVLGRKLQISFTRTKI